MTESFILYIKEGLTMDLVFLLPTNQQGKFLTNNTTARHINVTPVMGGVPQSKYQADHY